MASNNIKDYTTAAICREEADAALYASVGLSWLAGISERNARRIREGATALVFPKVVTACAGRC